MMRQYLIYSSLAHSVLFFLLIWKFAPGKIKPQKAYYIDFISTSPQISTPQDEAPQKSISQSKNLSAENKEPIVKSEKNQKTDYQNKDDFSDTLKPSMASAESKLLKDLSGKSHQSSDSDNSQRSVNTDSDFPYPWYITQIRESLWDSWRKIMPINSSLKCSVSFKIRPNGTFYDLEVETSSGNRIFDQAALSAVENAEKFPPLPEGFFEEYLTVHVEFKNKGV
ncbi:MAG: TonB family protein [Elusimicrobia bacterium]|nr:TonB family protein [Elusimicrobiota bacterium]